MSFSSFGCLSHFKQKPGKYWMSGNQIVYWKRNIKVTTPTRLGKVLTKIYLIPSSWTKEMWSLFFFFYFQVEVLNKSSIHSNQHHNQKIRNPTRHLITTPNAKHPTQHRIHECWIKQTLIDSTKASSRIPFLAYPGGGYGKHRDIALFAKQDLIKKNTIKP